MLKIILIVVLIATSVTAKSDDALSDRLDIIHTKIINDYASVAHLSANQFSQMDKQALMVFDVREPDEYEVSHIDGAIQIDPQLEPEQFLQQYGESIIGKTVVFYCSVGRRSSKFASQINAATQPKAAIATYNLTGGLFHWHNAQKPLVNQQQTTSAIHPYNFYWARLIESRSSISYSPIPAP